MCATRQTCWRSPPAEGMLRFSDAWAAHLQRPQKRGVEVQRQERVDDLDGVLLEDQARVEVRRVSRDLRQQAHSVHAALLPLSAATSHSWVNTSVATPLNPHQYCAAFQIASLLKT